MDLSTLTPEGGRKQRKRVGRGPGSGNGKTAGRGHKGQKSRSGYARRRAFEGGQMPLNRRLPKRGFYHESRHPHAIVNLGQLDKAFSDGDEVTLSAAVKARLVRPEKGGLKILATGKLTKKLTVRVHAMSAAARQQIEAAGGTVELLPAVQTQNQAAGQE